MDKDFALRRECGLCDSGFAHQALRSGDDFVAPRFERDSHQEGCDQAERNAYGQRGQQVDAHFGNRRIDQEQAPKVSSAMPPTVSTPCVANLASAAKRANAPRISPSAAKRVGRKFSAKAASRMKHYADGSRNHRAGMIEFDVECERADGENQERDVRVHQSVQGCVP